MGKEEEVKRSVGKLRDDLIEYLFEDRSSLAGEVFDELISLGMHNYVKEDLEKILQEWDLNWRVKEDAQELLGHIKSLHSDKLGEKKDEDNLDFKLRILLQRISDKPEDLHVKDVKKLKLLGKQAVQKLINWLYSEKEKTRISVVGALGLLEDKEAVPALLDALDRERWYFREHVLRALGYIEDEIAVDKLIEILQDEEETIKIREKAALALTCIGNQEAIKPMIEFLKNYEIGSWKGVDLFLSRFGDLVIEPLMESTKSSNKSIKYYSIKILGEIGDQRAFDIIVESLNDSSIDIVNIATSSLKSISKKRAHKYLLELLSNDVSSVCPSMILKLGDLRDKRLTKYLHLVLKHEDWVRRRSIAHKLGMLGETDAVEQLIEAYPENERRVKEAIIEALGRIGDKKSVNVLMEALNEESSELQSGAITALGRLGDSSAVKPLLDLFEDSVRAIANRIVSALALIGDSRANDLLIHELTLGNKTEKNVIVSALTLCENKELDSKLLQLLETESTKPEVKRDLSSILIHKNSLPVKKLEELLIELYDDLFNPQDTKHSKEIIESLTLINNQEAVKALLRALNHYKRENTTVRSKEFVTFRRIIQALGELRSKEATISFVKILSESDNFTEENVKEITKSEIIKALGQIEDQRSADSLIKILKNPQEKTKIRKSVISALSSFLTLDEIVNLLESTFDERVGIRNEFAKELIDLGYSKDNYPYIPSKPVEKYIELLKDEDFIEREKAAQILGYIRDEEVVKPLLESLNERNWQVRWEISRALKKHASKETLDIIIDLLKDENHFTRIGAAETLGVIGDPIATNQLIESLKDKKGAMGDSIIALGKIKSKIALEPLIKIVDDIDIHDCDRLSAISVLGDIGDDKAVECLMEHLNDFEEDIRAGVVGALGKLDAIEAIPLLKKRLRNESSSKVSDVLKGALKRLIILEKS